MKIKTFGTLFSGGGLADVGLRAAGLHHVWGVEIDPARAALARLNGFGVKTCDVRAVDPKHLPLVDWLHASPPCTEYTQANPKAAQREGGRTTALDLELARVVLNVVGELRPHFVSIENVLGWRESEPAQMILRELLDFDYCIKGFVLNAADYGVPQSRRRYFILASRHTLPKEPSPTHSEHASLLGLSSWVGWAAACPDWRDLELRPLTERMAKLNKHVEGRRVLSDARFLNRPKLVLGGAHQPIKAEDGDRLPIHRFEAEPSPAMTQRSVLQVVTCEGARTLSAAHIKTLSGLPPEWLHPDNLALLRSVCGLGVCPPVMRALVEAQNEH